MLFYTFLLTTIPFFSGPGNCTEIQWHVTGKSKVEISGTTNVSDFHCLSVNYEGQDTMEESCPLRDGSSSLSGQIIMKSVGFDCHKPSMNKDFAKTIKANEFPEIGIRFVELKKSLLDKKVLFGKVEITLAGKSKTYSVSCVVKEDGENTKQLDGNQVFRFSDFGLQAPKKLFGVIRTSDSIIVSFQLDLKKCENCN